MNEEEKIKYMRLALNEARRGLKNGDVPVGAIIVKDEKIVAKAFNKKEKKQNAVYHAEVLAIQKACRKLKSFRLDDCEMFVTLEPCPMCAGAIVGARLKKVYFGASDKNYGCAGSTYNLLNDKIFETTVETESGILESECSKILKDFFASIRKKKRVVKTKGKEKN